jgi:site-specific recombinase XerD
MQITRVDFESIQQQFFFYLTQERKATENTIRSYKADLGQVARFWETLEEREQKSFLIDEVLKRFTIALFTLTIDHSSIARKMSCFNSLKKFLKKLSIVLLTTFKRPYVKPKEPQALNVHEVFHLMDFPEETDLPTKHPLRDKAIIELLYATGIRCSELVQIELSNIHFNTQSIVIRAKRKKERMVLFGAKADERIKAYLQYERPEAQNPHERLFLNYRGTPLTVRSVQRICAMFRQCFENKQVITPCILRHSFATHMLTNGADVETVQELLGHKVRASTERYIHKTAK